jgi:N-acetylmuramic acid 6-phosphate etherase
VTAKLEACEFLKIASQFKLGHLVTEGFHPKTQHLSDLAKKDLKKALALLQEVDRDALEVMKSRTIELWELYLEIRQTLDEGSRIFLVGCGATGRLSLVLETLFRQKMGDSHQVCAFMAGGDYALIKSVENFEDQTEFGARQLMELGFSSRDLLIASTEGGETPFVIGATQKAKSVSMRSPYFLYCNPDDVLMPLKRSREVLEDHSIKKINLTTGPMAISGSTRMQASTVLMLGIGVGLLFKHDSFEKFNEFYLDFIHRLGRSDYSLFAPLTKLEATLYRQSKFLNYISPAHLAISILTDTTERSPTFSLTGFENNLDTLSEHALSYLFISGTTESAKAWRELLGRDPRAVEWEELGGKINLERVLGFDISIEGMKKREKEVPCTEFSIEQDERKITFKCGEQRVSFEWGEEPLFLHLMIKMILNAHSTLVMGLLERFEGNVMTWVRPSNNKLIDRAARYVLQILKSRQISATYEEVVEKIFEELNHSQKPGPVVLRVVERF